MWLANISGDVLVSKYGWLVPTPRRIPWYIRIGMRDRRCPYSNRAAGWSRPTLSARSSRNLDTDISIGFSNSAQGLTERRGHLRGSGNHVALLANCSLAHIEKRSWIVEFVAVGHAIAASWNRPSLIRSPIRRTSPWSHRDKRCQPWSVTQSAERRAT